MDVARSEGLDEPIAVTARWDNDQASDESLWQEQVARAIGIHQWEILWPGTDLDLLGDEAIRVLDRIGLVWPPPSYAMLPMMRLAAGGVFVTGEGGMRRSDSGPMGVCGPTFGSIDFRVRPMSARWLSDACPA